MLDHLHIAPPVEGLAERVQAAIDAKTKPPGSLGRIEQLALQIAVAQGTEAPEVRPWLLLFAGDHGLVEEGVSAWPSEVTAQMVQNFLAGGAAANVFARTNGAQVIVADVGVAADLPDHPDLRRAGIRRGTRNAAVEDAMTAAEAEAALHFGAGLAQEAIAEGATVIALGEMGIGNTSAAALLAHAVAEIPLATLTGPGAGLDRSGITHKRSVLMRAAGRHPDPLGPNEALAAFGGLEIAAMTGAAIAAASGKAVVVVDGFIATAAAMIAVAARPEIALHLVYAHRSHEPGHQAMLARLGAQPLLDLDLRLGEGSGALLALPLLRAATAMLAEMATFESAGVSGKEA
ncbi:nicotinate-nucleotide--dimethylbenzimidazole phosphoribosyltransferase [Rhodobacteraceae bacterium NNCM2]|nr:nicotinate-nucleotide--dimethylbenzimidazole phosphoribosyltransferase [Coraliihabitans acroporae]